MDGSGAGPAPPQQQQQADEAAASPSSGAPSSHADAVRQFQDLTGCDAAQAAFLMDACGGDTQAALAMFFGACAGGRARERASTSPHARMQQHRH